MAQTHKSLGYATPAAAGSADLYTVPPLTTTICSCFTITNTDRVGQVDDVICVHLVPTGGSADETNAVLFDLTIPYGDPFAANLAHTLDAGTKIVVTSTTGKSTFIASGLEIT